jgi:hypothetical protein
MSTIEDQISAARDRLRVLEERRKKNEARRKSIESKMERKAETRRKILVGAIVLARVEQGRLDQALLRGWMDEALERTDDRALFGLGEAQR